MKPIHTEGMLLYSEERYFCDILERPLTGSKADNELNGKLSAELVYLLIDDDKLENTFGMFVLHFRRETRDDYEGSRGKGPWYKQWARRIVAPRQGRLHTDAAMIRAAMAAFDGLTAWWEAGVDIDTLFDPEVATRTFEVLWDTEHRFIVNVPDDMLLPTITLQLGFEGTKAFANTLFDETIEHAHNIYENQHAGFDEATANRWEKVLRGSQWNVLLNHFSVQEVYRNS